MSPIKFMGEQEDPELAVIEARGNTRIYDGTKRSLLDDVRDFLEAVADRELNALNDACRTMTRDEEQDAAIALLKRIDGGER